MAGDRPRNLTFGSVAERYERFRPGYPEMLRELVLAGTRPEAALEVGAGTGKATRVFAGNGLAVTAGEPDPQMCAVLCPTACSRASAARSTSPTRTSGARVEEERAGVIEDEDVPGTEDQPDEAMRWPGGELAASPYFADVEEHDLTSTDRLAADDLVGLMSTVSAHLLLDEPVRAALLRRVRSLLPDTVEVRRDLTLHRARRTHLR